MDQYFAVTAPGLEPLAAGELIRLGLLFDPPRKGTGIESGGVAFEGDLRAVSLANLHLRTASRILVRLGDFYAVSFPELVKKAGRLPWEKYLRPGQPVALHVTCHKSRLYHSGAVAERVMAAIAGRLGKASQMVKARPDEETPVEVGAAGERAGQAAKQPPAGSTNRQPPSPALRSSTQAEQPPQMVVVRFVNDLCTISVDSSGELLHRRGYRLETAKAPLRETLAAAMLLASGWDSWSPLVDPFCGSGTIAIEAAMLALGLPPGQRRRFAFMDWPGFDRKAWDTLLSAASPRAQAEMPILQASDRDAGAIRIAQANAERAGVAAYIQFETLPVSAIHPPAGPGCVVTNPPYGIRVSASKDLRNLYAQFGNVLRAKCPGWQVAVLCSDLKLLGQMGIKLDTSFSTINGGVNVRLGRGRVE